METTLASRLHALFSGLPRAHGSYHLTGELNGFKNEGKAVTLRQPATIASWQAHLEGQCGLGIVPIRDDASVVFGAIDVDQYEDLNLATVASTLHRLQLPLIPCRSKSGGVHIYLFTKEPVAAGEMQDKLCEISAILGFGGSEIFPKQRRLLVEHQEMGSWINMPYFDADNTTRYAINRAGDALSAGEFLDAADASKVGIDFFAAKLGQNQGPLPFGPPCLQCLVQLGFTQGSRNNALFNLGVYAKKANPDGFATDVETYNREYIKPPLDHVEVGNTIKSLRKKTYEYRCREQPIAAHCNVGVCKSRKYGIGNTGLSMPELGALVKFDSNPPLWFWDADGERIELTTEELMDYSKFQVACLTRLNKMLPDLKRGEWKACIAKALETLQIETVPEDASPDGQLWELLEQFCTGRTQAMERDEIVMGKPFSDNEDGRTYFRLPDFLRFLERKRFKHFSSQKITAILKARGVLDHQIKIHGKNVRVRSVKQFQGD